MQTNPQIIKNTPHDHGPMREGAHGPSNLSGPSSGQPQRPLRRNSASLEGWPPPRANLRLTRGLAAPSGETPPRSRAGRPLRRISASLEGWPPPRAKLRLAQGLVAPSGESPPCSRLPQARGPCAHSPDQSIKCSDTTRALGSKVNPPPCRPFDTTWESYLGVVSPTLLVRPSLPLYGTMQ
jgi:hypothetical protein